MFAPKLQVFAVDLSCASDSVAGRHVFADLSEEEERHDHKISERLVLGGGGG
jgi:hypothetical protein